MGPSAVKGPIPPWHQFRDFLDPLDHAALLDWTLSNRGRFKPSGVIGGVDVRRRFSGVLSDLGPLHKVIEERVRTALPQIFSHTGGRPFDVEHVELELAAHGEGAFFVRHVDIPVGRDRKPLGGDTSGTQDRLVSAVYYYHRDPKGFSGGALRLHRFAGCGDPGEFVDVEPEQNSLVVFPSGWSTKCCG
jgi:Rps23 Pro-64 3,4-dihydroxylase Tpa1-like proline 4-hydroxylase